ncbi:hypothetical protein T12_12572 [Trichinella patagoniensis]|uniref:Uncharacterized protein n=1 Tax=Trichinella patagoniensis TaxID=990121 RepID=A0A0V0ZEA6_9BILA|nr:hypothetical protein T12_12572 [Trichinella patagoniensis]
MRPEPPLTIPRLPLAWNEGVKRGVFVNHKPESVTVLRSSILSNIYCNRAGKENEPVEPRSGMVLFYKTWRHWIIKSSFVLPPFGDITASRKAVHSILKIYEIIDTLLNARKMVADGCISIQVAEPDDILTIDAENTFAFSKMEDKSVA